MRIRLNLPPKGNPILFFSDDSTSASLFQQISTITNWPQDEIIIKKGFPPQKIQVHQTDKLNEILKDGDSIIPQNIKSLGTQAVTTRPIPKSILEKSKSSRPDPINKISDKPKKTRKNLSKSGRKSSKTTPPVDWAENLVQLFEKSSKNLLEAEKSLKGVFKNAIQRRYRSSQAEKRWASVQGSTYEINMVLPYKFNVIYPSGPRSKTQEHYIALPKELMQSVIKEAYNSSEASRMNLRPYYLAEAQPLIFWNLVRLFDGKIFSGFSELIPEINWSYLNERHKELSEKAKENIRQKNEAIAIKTMKKNAKNKKLQENDEK